MKNPLTKAQRLKIYKAVLAKYRQKGDDVLNNPFICNQLLQMLYEQYSKIWLDNEHDASKLFPEFWAQLPKKFKGYYTFRAWFPINYIAPRIRVLEAAIALCEGKKSQSLKTQRNDQGTTASVL